MSKPETFEPDDFDPAIFFCVTNGKFISAITVQEKIKVWKEMDDKMKQMMEVYDKLPLGMTKFMFEDFIPQYEFWLGKYHLPGCD